MNFHFRAADQLTICLLLVCVIASIGIQYIALNGLPFQQVGQAIEYDAQAQREYRFELDVNTATWSELTLLPGIGERLANRIVDYRIEKGEIRDLDELNNVDGIGPKKMEGIRKYLQVNRRPAELQEESNGV